MPVAAAVALDAYLGKQLEDAAFRHHFEQRRLVRVSNAIRVPEQALADYLAGSR